MCFPHCLIGPVYFVGKKTRLFDDSLAHMEIEEGRIRPGAKHRHLIRTWRDRWAPIHTAEQPTLTQQSPISWDELSHFIHITPYLRRFIPGRANLVMKIKNAFFDFKQMMTPTDKQSLKKEEVPKEKPDWGYEHRSAVRAICDAILNKAIYTSEPPISYCQ